MPQKAKLVWNGAATTAKVRAAAARGLGKAAEHLLGEARNLVPLEEGTLSDSGVASVDEDALTAAVSFDTPYAVPVHENLTARHDAGRQAKYLETPLEGERDTMLELVAVEVKQALK